MAKKTNFVETPIVCQQQYPSGNPALGKSNAIPADTSTHMESCHCRWPSSNEPCGEFTHRVKGKE
jgi:hypothetical protein